MLASLLSTSLHHSFITILVIDISYILTIGCKIGNQVVLCRQWMGLKGPLKYLVAKLQLLPRCKFTSGQPKFFARFFRRRLVADSSRCLTFLLHCNKHKKHFLITFLLINVLLYGYNMWVVPLFFKLEYFAWKYHPRTDVLTESGNDCCMLMGKSQKGDSTRFPLSG